MTDQRTSAGLPALRFGPLALGGIALLAGLTGALVLLGVSMPSETVRLAASHGILMALGFLGTVIALERAVALGRPWGFVAPLVAGAGGIALLVGVPPAVGAGLLAGGGVGLVAIYAAILRVESSLHGTVQALGAVAWPIAAVLVATGRPVATAVPWLAAFLVLTILGERLELSRLVRPTGRTRWAFVLAVAVLTGGVVLSLGVPDAGLRLAGAGLVGLAAWLARNDLARRTVRATGVTRFIAVALLSGYGWLAVAGATWVAFGAMAPARAHDAGIHALFLGFVMSMVFGHAPIIVPAVLRLPLVYHRAFYLHLALLHASLIVRIGVGGVFDSTAAWQSGGVLNVVAVLAFVAITAAAATAGAIGAGGTRSGSGRSAPSR
jgi:hypothetical protein